jgi:putative glutamine amidotransferase
MRSLPLIGVTLDSEEAGGWSKLPWYALRRNYFSAIVAAGGLPVALPHHPEMAEAYLAEVDGLVVTGGAFDVDPALWGGGAPQARAWDLRRAAIARGGAWRAPDPAHPG